MLAGFGKAALAAGDVGSEEEMQTLEVLSSIPQGRTLRDDAKALGWKVNHKFKGMLILADKASKPVTLDGLTITVAGPMKPELLALQKEHDKWLSAQKKKKKKSSEAALAAFVDKSIPNLSSIVVLAEMKKKSILLTGDARGDKILEGMKLSGMLEKGKRHVDILKVPHHGSDNNMETGFFEKVTADHYVFSGDGEHGNPERATLEMLLDARGTDAEYTIHLTYPVAEIDKGAQGRLGQGTGARRRSERRRKDPGKGRNWSAAAHSLASFFEKNPEFAEKVVIVDKRSKPHLIDLLEPLEP